MWALVKADFLYTRLGLGIIAFFVAFFFVQSATISGWHFATFVNNTAVSAMIGMGIMGASADKERRDRTMIALPITINRVGVARLIYVNIVFAALMVVWSIFLVVRPGGVDIQDVWIMFNAASVAMTLFLGFMIHHDLGFYETWRYRIMIYVGVAVFLATIAVLGISGYMDEVGKAYGNFFETFTGVLVHFVAAAATFYLSLRVFERRRSYLK